MKPKRNEACPCGSGKKYKVCCANKRTSTQWLALGAVIVFAIGAVWVVGGTVRRLGSAEDAAPPGKVWAEEHGHWHDAPTPGGVQPPGPVPPGKVWSAEHGHWHDAPAPGLPPAGDAPPGKVWSADHGHWHDAPGDTWEPPAEVPAELPESAVSYVEEP